MKGGEAATGLAAEAGRTAATRLGMSLKVNLVKSGVIGTNPQRTSSMPAAAGPLFGCTTALKDLGVIHRGIAARPPERVVCVDRRSSVVVGPARTVASRGVAARPQELCMCLVLSNSVPLRHVRD